MLYFCVCVILETKLTNTLSQYLLTTTFTYTWNIPIYIFAQSVVCLGPTVDCDPSMPEHSFAINLNQWSRTPSLKD